jgi:predicted nucleic acid-binding protein
MPGIVVADAGPLRYLVLTGYAKILPRLFGTVAVPTTVVDELRHPRSPAAVRIWVATPPAWIAVHPDPVQVDAGLRRLDPGEQAAIALAGELGGVLLLIDDRAGVAAAREQGFRVTGTLGVLVEAARLDLLDLEAAFTSLRGTNFRQPRRLLAILLAEDRARRHVER